MQIIYKTSYKFTPIPINLSDISLAKKTQIGIHSLTISLEIFYKPSINIVGTFPRPIRFVVGALISATCPFEWGPPINTRWGPAGTARLSRQGVAPCVTHGGVRRTDCYFVSRFCVTRCRVKSHGEGWLVADKFMVFLVCFVWFLKGGGVVRADKTSEISGE